jgi:hypothetical protein
MANPFLKIASLEGRSYIDYSDFTTLGFLQFNSPDKGIPLVVGIHYKLFAGFIVRFPILFKIHLGSGVGSFAYANQ